ncbi:DUF2793 domain-containing protein [Sphingomonas sp. CFBP 13603]|uniref:DUF2793 domain-containing protein n=1 Tax=Sphingomonas sp. CFBP 13603 TaxID=2774040 RepID=UPI0018690098|nr:DUF2793 domain-containing protein [Sphingomonas sp. CFBP 13603]MBE2993122.1 DUF2793 domain-containing protein [Sphingomonas sp. CFBP 13603]
MSDDITPRLALPLLQPGQAQKETTHNEALVLLDLTVQASVLAVGTNVPPAAPAAGQAWIVGAAPTGGWLGQPGTIAGWTSGGWRFLVPREGMAVWSVADGQVARFGDGVWTLGVIAGSRVAIGGNDVVGARRAAVPEPIGGSIVDIEARAAIAAILGGLRGHGLIAG